MSELNLILLGPPGAGKGTQAERLKDDFGLPYIGTGELLRKHTQAGSELGREAAPYMERGDLVPDELVIRMILEELDQNGRDETWWFVSLQRSAAERYRTLAQRDPRRTSPPPGLSRSS